MRYGIKLFVACGVCGCYHPLLWRGDCRADDNRFLPDELDAIYGCDGWQEVDEDEAIATSEAVDKVLHGSVL